MGLFETLNQLGILSVGRRPEWRQQHETDGLPMTPGAGISIAGSVKTLVAISARENVAFHSVRISLAYDGASTYSITVDGTTVTVPADTDLPTTLDAIARELRFNLTIRTVCTAKVDGDVILLQGVGAALFPVVVSESGGAGTITAMGDATDIKASVYLLAGGVGTRPPTWVLARNVELEADERGVVERLDTAGFDRMYVHVVADGVCSVFIGPGVVE